MVPKLMQPRISIYRIVFFSTLLLIALSGASQNYTCNLKSNWFFGRGLSPSGVPTGEVMKMEFQCPSGNLISHGPQMIGVTFGNEGSAVINDLYTGNWQLFSDGDNILFPSLPTMTGFGGNPSSSTTVLICPINLCPVDSFYYFSNPTTGSNAGLIQVAQGNLNGNFSSQVNLPIPPSSSVGGASNLKHGEGMWLIPISSEPGNFWLVTRLLKNNGNSATDALITYKITPSGIVIHQIFNLNSDFDNNIASSALNNVYFNFNYSHDRQEMAISNGGPGISVATIGFDDNTGFFNGSVANVINLGSLGAYDVEYSPNSNYLYYNKYEGGDLFAYDLSNSTSLQITDNQLPGIKRGVGIQTGPDGNIYYISNATSNWSIWNSEIWQIPNPNNPAPVAISYAYWPDWMLGNLPTFVVVPEFNLYAASNNLSLCPNDSIKIGLISDVSGLSIANSYWYHNGNIIPGQNDTILYAHQSGEYKIEIELLNGCVYSSDSILINSENDLFTDITNIQCTSTSAIIDIDVCNLSDSTFQGNFNLTVYDNDPLTTSANELATQSVFGNIGPLSCQSVQFIIPGYSGPIHAVLNDPGGQITPLNLNQFPLNSITECDYLNNFSDTIITCCFGNLNLTDTSICSNNFPYQMSVSPIAGGSIEWFSDNNYSNSIGTGATLNAQNIIGTTVYYVEETSANCVYHDSISVTVKPTPIVSAGNDTTICAQESITLTAFNPDNATLSWNNSVIDGMPFNPTNSSQYIATVDLAGCLNSDTVEITVNPLPEVYFNNDTVLCEGDSVQFIENNLNGATSNWNPSISSGDYLSPGIGTTIYTTLQELNGCTLNDTFEISVFELPILTIPNDSSLCFGEEISLSANSTMSNPINWTGGINNGMNFIPGLGVNIYVASTENSGCISADTLQISVLPNPNFDIATEDADYCAQSLGSIEFIPTTQTSDVYILNGPNGSTNNLTIDHLNPGTYTFEIIDSNGCVFIADVIINENFPTYNTDFTYSPLIVNTSSPNVDFSSNGSNAANYTWTIDGNTFGSTDFLSHAFLLAGDYEVCLIAEYSAICVDTLCQSITVYDDLILHVPNSFTPNGDNNNNLFFPVFSSPGLVDEYYIEIYNRWGELIFESDDIYQKWPGTYRGVLVQDGVYVWRIKYSDVYSDFLTEKKGHVTVVK